MGEVRGVGHRDTQDKPRLSGRGAVGASGADLQARVPLLVRGDGGPGVRPRRCGPRHHRRRGPALRGGELVALFYCGLDLGQTSDYTALALIEVPVWLGPEVDFSGWHVPLPPELEGAGWV